MYLCTQIRIVEMRRSSFCRLMQAEETLLSPRLNSIKVFKGIVIDLDRRLVKVSGPFFVAPDGLPMSVRVRSERPVSHATRRGECREECCERGYYHLHRQLNDPFLRHTLGISRSRRYRRHRRLQGYHRLRCCRPD